MSSPTKSQQEILNKLGIARLNPMQEEAIEVLSVATDLVLLSPTGSGKTLAFLLPILEMLDSRHPEVQALILVPSRELALQIEQVIRDMGAGFKTHAIYGGRAIAKDKQDLRHRPSILIGTPGRIADHLRRGTFGLGFIHTLVLDEFDKSLEVGFETEMAEILEALPSLKRRILTSATHEVEVPGFVGLKDPVCLDYLEQSGDKLTIKTILSPSKDKLDTLVAALRQLGSQPGVVFCNFKESIQRVSEHLTLAGIAHGCFYGGMDQTDRERALIKFRNGTHQLLIATDLAARGLDIPEIRFIIHYHLPLKSQEFTHRNGRTARMHNEGIAYVLKWEEEMLPDFIGEPEIQELQQAPVPPASPWQTLFISGGRRDKISKGDLAGLFFKQGGLTKGQLGKIELKQDCAFVAVHASEVARMLPLLDNSRIKKKKIRVRPI